MVPSGVVDRLCPSSIVVKMFPVVMTAATFGNQWAGQVIQFVIDNMAIVEVIKATYSKEPVHDAPHSV